MNTPVSTIDLSIPADASLPELLRVWDIDWAWLKFCDKFGEAESPPDRIRPDRIRYRPGKSALVTYSAEWVHGKWILDDRFAIELRKGKRRRVFKYPDDPYLPGLKAAADGIQAHDLFNKFLSASPNSVKVEVVRYRPGSRAVLRHIGKWRGAQGGKVRYFARVMRKRRVARLVTAFDVIKESGFEIPHLAGVWEEGGVAWVSRVRGKTVRSLVGQGSPPDTKVILDHVSKLWDSSHSGVEPKPLNLLGGFRTSTTLMQHILRDRKESAVLNQLANVLGPFAEQWEPVCRAHNDFHDDQIIVTPDNRFAMVDFEEAGPGDPVLDVGNLLAHQTWMAVFGNKLKARSAFRNEVRTSALNRFGWNEHELDLREAFSLYRMAANPFTQLRPNWPDMVGTALNRAASMLNLNVPSAPG